MEVCIAGDFCSRERISDLVNRGEMGIFTQIREVLDGNALNVVNLEAPLISPSANIQLAEKSGPAICQLPNALEAIRFMGFNCVTLANNHFRDYGEIGCLNTLHLVDEMKLMRMGGGRNFDEASKVFYYSNSDNNKESVREYELGVVNFCENEWSIAGETKAGAAAMDEITNYHQIKEAKERAEHVIVIVHGGIERYQYPTPRMVQLYRWFVEIGADVVINHHQHCYSGYEKYHNGLIFYGLGNFCFDWAKQRSKDWCEGFMVKLHIEKGRTLSDSYELIPYIQCDDTPGVRLMDEEEKRTFEKKIKRINAIITDEQALQRQFELHVGSSWGKFRAFLSPYTNKYMLALCRRGLLPLFMSRKKMRLFMNLIRCESHRQEMIEMLNQKLLLKNRTE